MLTVRKSRLRPWPVTVRLQECDEATGAVTEIQSTFVLLFTPFTEEEYHAVVSEGGDEIPPEEQARIAALPPAEAAAALLGRLPPPHEILARNARRYPRLIGGWSGVTDENGQPIAYSAAALAELVTGPDGMAVSRAINLAIDQIRRGEAPRKNSSTSPEAGPVPAADEAPTS